MALLRQERLFHCLMLFPYVRDQLPALMAERLGLRLGTTRLGKFETGIDCNRVRVRVRKLDGGRRVEVDK
jgi:hypothetical protein